MRARRSSRASRRIDGGGSVDDCLSRVRTSRKRDHTRRRLPILLSVQRVPRGAEDEKGGLLRLLLIRRCEVSIRATKRWMLSSARAAGFTAYGLRLAHGRWRDVFPFYEGYPQKRITAEIELIDKRNVQTYVDRAVVRPLRSLAVPKSPFLLKPLGFSFSPSYVWRPARARVRVVWNELVLDIALRVQREINAK